MANEKKFWLEHLYFQTYEIAAAVDNLACDPFGHLTLMTEFMIDDFVLELIRPWPNNTALHKFIRWVVDRRFLEDTDGPYVSLDRPEIIDRFGDILPKECGIQALPVDLGLLHYGLSEELFEIPKPVIESHQVTSNRTKHVVANVVEMADACYDYFEELQLSAPYEELLDRIAEEVFYVMFTNRNVLYNLNLYLASHVGELERCEDEEREEYKYVKKKGGSLLRRQPPEWARRAVFYRDRGRCTFCRCDLSSLVDAIPRENFDHMVPLASGGLNDVTNLQLLCCSCNSGKGARGIPASNAYRRWWPAGV